MSCEFFGTCTNSTLIGTWQIIDVNPKDLPKIHQSDDQDDNESSSLDSDESDDESENVYCENVASEDESSEEEVSDQFFSQNLNVFHIIIAIRTIAKFKVG